MCNSILQKNLFFIQLLQLRVVKEIKFADAIPRFLKWQIIIVFFLDKIIFDILKLE